MSNLEDALTPHVESGRVPGLVALVARGTEVETLALGRRSEDGEPMTEDSLFRFASITKPLTAAAALTLVDDGLLDLDSPVADWLPELAAPVVLREASGPLDDVVPATTPITLRHLLSSTAGHGFPGDFLGPVVAELMGPLHQGPPDPPAAPEPDEWMARLGQLPLLHQPGEGWTYNTAYDVLGVLVARASGDSFARYLREHVLDPLGMVGTGFWLRDRADLPRMTSQHRRDDQGELVVTDPPDGHWVDEPAFCSGAGGLLGTAADWLAFGQMLLAGGTSDGHRVLSEDLVRLMMVDHLTEPQHQMGDLFLQGQGWGFGGSVDVAELEPWNVPGRYGWVGGTGTSAHVVPRDGAVTVLLTQVELGSPEGAQIFDDFWRAAAS
ncbi:serine hydrolase domain-containing protein [Auraticoccus monumenti]|uniref:CubicO group peptidase, beta-lactamase class C family n=1 Tax=Auraticoccus monumenti TaxID=675864 RepID=A0A1G6YNU3_9ACTN|nr:serine hydrolase domain-containing protein [Auraticoccus monumenti]SDD91206.1 CubicO group peptidase, beta-lactamase class C family [Auraticoccus monumenti]